MKTPRQIPSLILALCVLQWPSMLVNSASTAVSSQLSYGQSSGSDQKDASSSGLLGAIYRKSRQSRCVTCYDDRYDDRRPYGGYSRSGDDRPASWYYPRNDRYEDRYRDRDVADYDRYSYDRYETRGYRRGSYGGESRGYGYDNRDDYDRRYGGYSGYSEKRGYDRGEMRGYGYDSRDRYYGADRGADYLRGADYPRDRIYDRPRYGTGYGSHGYDRDYYDRYSPRTQTGYDKSAGSGYYYAKGSKEDRRYLPEPTYDSRYPCGVQKPNCPYAPQDAGTRVTSGPIDSSHHPMGTTHSIYNPGANHNDSSRGPGAGWSYMREEESDRQPARAGNGNSGNNGGESGNGTGNRDRDSNRDQQSPAYGALLDRGSNLIAVEPAKSNEDGQENSDQSKSTSSSPSAASTDDNGQPNTNGQNS